MYLCRVRQVEKVRRERTKANTSIWEVRVSEGKGKGRQEGE